MRKNKALNAFKADDSEIKVIMFSLAKAASGTNLVAATHIMLLGTNTFPKPLLPCLASLPPLTHLLWFPVTHHS
jgi:hypothetical protein